MTAGAPNEIFSHIVDVAAHHARQFEYVKRGKTLRKIGAEIVSIIEFQKSARSTSEQMAFTINLAIVSEHLLEGDHPSIERIGSPYGHFRERIGALLPDHPDKWWIIDDKTVEDALASEISAIVVDRAVPHLERLLSLDALVHLWASGISPGLTAVQRADCLARARQVNDAGMA